MNRKTIVNDLISSVNEKKILHPGRVLVLRRAESGVEGYWLRQTGGDLGTAESDEMHGSLAEIEAFVRGILFGLVRRETSNGRPYARAGV